MTDPTPSALDAMFHANDKPPTIVEAVAKNITIIIGVVASIVPITEAIRSWHESSLNEANQKHERETNAANQEQQIEIEFLKLVVGKDVAGDDRRRVLEVLRNASRRTTLSVWADKEARQYDLDVKSHQRDNARYEASLDTERSPESARLAIANQKIVVLREQINEATDKHDFVQVEKLKVEFYDAYGEQFAAQNAVDKVKNKPLLLAGLTAVRPSVSVHSAAPTDPTPPHVPAQTSGPPDQSDPFDVDFVSKLFPFTPRSNIAINLPFVLAALKERGLSDHDMTLYALAAIRVQTASFLPVPEGQSRFNTPPNGLPFGLYEPGTHIGRALGNVEAGDGARFKGRGYLQITGREAYRRYGQQIGVDLVGNPDLACDGKVAAEIVAQFVKNNEMKIRSALAANDLKSAMRLLTGGSLGLDQFSNAFTTGRKLLRDPV
ncbi:MAG: hypothetical protein JO261_06600 [Alphaproteobacteria bacterium]|nr:hypothetical protein [Alphaproteobacteria bacterium]MBV9693354.1 hypothetical protein [Alphaproteobacteria bacterium]